MSTDWRARMLASLKHEEGFRGTPYRCSENVLTVGYGTTFPITEDEADWLLRQRLQRIQTALGSRALAEYRIDIEYLPEGPRRAVIEMAYQMGVSGCLAFRKMWAAIGSGDWVAAHDEALDSRWAKQTPARAGRMAHLLLNGRLRASLPATATTAPGVGAAQRVLDIATAAVERMAREGAASAVQVAAVKQHIQDEAQKAVERAALEDDGDHGAAGEPAGSDRQEVSI